MVPMESRAMAKGELLPIISGEVSVVAKPEKGSKSGILKYIANLRVIQEITRRVNLSDSIISVIGHEHVAACIYSKTVWTQKLSCTSKTISTRSKASKS